ncbi:MAG: 7-cyano-7-deazaguanine synthase QueC [Proteobacteria bacterium]|nr:7-cyano-7-deazaguanine synthase QueC [Pseudomonadota bacterium]
MKKAVILLSGGMDSATILTIALDQGYDCYALSYSYGQRHEVELIAANKIAKASAVKEHKTIEIDLGAFGGSALTADIPVPKHRTEIGGEIPITYVPARNTIFLSFALAYLDVIGADAIFIGVNALDYSGYPDCRPEYIEAFEKMANLATRRGVEGKHPIRIETPLLYMSKAGIIKAGAALKVDYGITISCYDPDKKGRACGACDACILRKNGFEEAGISDPTHYQ